MNDILGQSVIPNDRDVGHYKSWHLYKLRWVISYLLAICGIDSGTSESHWENESRHHDTGKHVSSWYAAKHTYDTAETLKSWYVQYTSQMQMMRISPTLKLGF